MNHAIDLIMFVILGLVGLILHVIGIIDGFLASLMTAAHVPANAQIILLVVIAVWLAVLAFRAFGGVFRVLIIILLLLLLFRVLLPGVQAPQWHVLTGPDAPAQGQGSI
jgi:hypothetical protein